jgi:acetoin utilization protein AcuB
MLVRDYMSSPAVSILPETGVQEALRIMHERKFRRLPVIDKGGHLIGIVSERDLLYASPSPATSLSVWELNYLLAKLTISEIMTRSVLIIAPDVKLQEAARLMLRHKVGGLPVVDYNNHLIGVITETDIFRAFLQQLETTSETLKVT